MNYAIEILLEQKTLIEGELECIGCEERTELQRRLIDTCNALNKLNIDIVSQRSELLKGFREFVNDRQNTGNIYNYDVTDYLKTFL